jgi:hypothetical protein
MSFRDWFLGKLRDRVADEPFALRIIFWEGEVFDFGAQPRASAANCRCSPANQCWTSAAALAQKKPR